LSDGYLDAMRKWIGILCVAALTLGATKLAAPPVSAFVGKYPFDKIAGYTFLRLPSVRTAVRNAVFSDATQARVLNPNSVTSPITRNGEFVLSWACEPHNCAWHQWSIVVTPSGRKGAVCYYNEELMRGERWFVDGSPVLEGTTKKCDPDIIPSTVALALVR
jgi:hypothetical protein